jgi:hypothetical protein
MVCLSAVARQRLDQEHEYGSFRSHGKDPMTFDESGTLSIVETLSDEVHRSQVSELHD